jgi:large subunit ribosomal protein L9
MKVILLQNIDGLGKRYDVKTVKDGYARNFLIPQHLVKPATKATLSELEAIKKREVKKVEEHLVETQKSASEIDGQEIVFSVKTGEEGRLFEAITSLKIVKKLKEMGFKIKKDQVILDKPLKELGEFPVKITLDHQLEANIRVIIESEKAEESEETDEE